jgi:S1-C subfamily serine protease
LFSQLVAFLEGMNSRPRSRWLAATAGVAALGAAAVLGFAPQAAQAVTLSTGVVDVNTTLGLENGAAAGTGIVLNASGEILTNNHVIRGATTATVTDPATGKTYAATVVGYSVTNDIAVIQLTGASKLHQAALGNSSNVKVGQKITAVGNALGKGGKPATAAGKVTGVRQTIVASDGQVSEQLTGLIKINAALQPGDSGGPLLNANGRVVGMDTAASVNFQFQTSHEGYAIPINHAITLAKQIVAGQASATVHIGSTPFIGVSVATDAQDVQGAVVAGIVAGSPAEAAGLVAGDTITQLNGQPVTSFDDLSTLLLQYNAGTTVTLIYTDTTGASQTASITTAVGPPQ